jgi:hypothetical protein
VKPRGSNVSDNLAESVEGDGMDRKDRANDEENWSSLRDMPVSVRYRGNVWTEDQHGEKHRPN